LINICRGEAGSGNPKDRSEGGGCVAFLQPADAAQYAYNSRTRLLQLDVENPSHRLYSEAVDVNEILKQMRNERDQLNFGIAALEKIAAGTSVKRRGRPPKWLSTIKSAHKPARGRPKKAKADTNAA
jgi:hypothetical protein